VSRAALALLLAAALAAPAAGASPHDQALADLKRGDDAPARRAAVRRLTDVGVMADLPAMAQALRDSDAEVRSLTENAMWEVWSRSGDASVDALFAAGVEQLAARNLNDAVQTFTRIIERRPEFAEAWNKRATVYYILGEYQKSLADCDEVMARNPYHWGALSGYGMIYFDLDQLERAAEYFEKALAVNPNLMSVQRALEAVRAMLAQRRREMI
jgi:tetratricopeptide (TPR) repeat protein